jgi:hypothetical protein
MSDDDEKPPIPDDDPMIVALRAAWSPGEIEDVDHAAIVAAAIDADERAEAEAFGASLDADPVVVALRAAWEPRAIDAAEHRAIVARALGSPHLRGEETGTNVVRFGRPARYTAIATAAFAIAAAFALRVTRVEEAPLARTRSTEPLFDEPFKPGEASARIDKIALARASDYRDNRFAKWGVR